MNIRAEKGANAGAKEDANKAARPNRNARGLRMNLTRRSLILANENPELWDRHLAEHMERYQPDSDLEREMVEDIAFCRWRLIRMRSIDTALWNIRMQEQARDLADTYGNLTEPARLARSFSADRVFESAASHEAHLRRSYDRAIRNLEQLRQFCAKQMGETKVISAKRTQRRRSVPLQ